MKWYQICWAQKYWGKAARAKYQKYLQSDMWQQKRASVLKLAGYTCRRCGARATEVHHETYKRLYKERLSDLTALCGPCHRKAHTKPLKKRAAQRQRHSSRRNRPRPKYAKRRRKYERDQAAR